MFRSGDIVKILNENCSNLPIYSHQKVDSVKEEQWDGELCEVVMIKGWMFEPEHLELVKRRGIFVKSVQEEVNNMVEPIYKNGITEVSVSEGGSLRYNKGKPEFSHLSPEFILEMMKTMTKSNEKYPYLNYTKKQDVKTASDSLMRHYLEFQLGNDLDNDTNCHHLAHLAVNAMIIFQNLKDYGEEVDNRYMKAKERVQNEV